MIDAKQAVQIAKERAADVFASGPFNLEEIEREQYKEHDVWAITLSLNRPTSMAQLANLSEYKRFMIDVETGELLGVTIREFLMRR